MSKPTEVMGVADADLVTSGGRGHLVQVDGSSNERLDLVTTSRSPTIIGALTNNNADTAADKAQFVFQGWIDGIAGTALEPFDLVQSETDSEFGLYVAGKGHVVVGMYLPEMRAGGTNLPDAAAGDKVRIFLFANKTTRRDADGCLKAVYDFAVDGGAISTIGLGVFFPDNAIVAQSAIDVLTTHESAGDTATIALTSTNITIDAAIAINDGGNPWDAGMREGDHQYDTAGTWQKTSSEQELNVVIAVQAVTAGKMVIFANYWISE
jgi:hypothetical protein